MTPLEAALAGVWLMIPALVPNSAAVIFGGGTPMDFGRSWRGKRVLGDGKTWRGFFGGALTGVVLGLILMGVAMLLDAREVWGYGDWPDALLVIVALPFGSMTGDAAGSFLKRRLGKDRGAKAPVLDQYNFVIGALLLGLLLAPNWVLDHYYNDNGIYGLVLLLIVVPLLHRGVNIIGYKMGKKDVPW
ncbi:MAG: CDP-2,3-bis-(O-geranylgeranyl)-sn-glycerol synthase [Thermoplasmata archaeon]|jgi:CDP-2,3-bis-(O-geranylgeranyl)-sn-glycerol synthase|nr:CDP-2,3-bis-(O-geranylgeranyl)-sn-glycerol synthase [Thermoplasmata archaeon]